MSWRAAFASEIGTSHVALGTPCQDSCIVLVEGGSDPVLGIFVSDGAGSAAFGGEGADLAVEVASRFWSEAVEKKSIWNEEFAFSCVAAVRAAIQTSADASGRSMRDYACTFLGVVASRSDVLLMQVGDGGIVIDFGDGLSAPIRPMSGMYANMTNFLTDDDALSVMAVRHFAGMITRVAAFTDGLQHLALHMATNSPHQPFFSRFFDVLAKTSEHQDGEVEAALRRFLQSTAVNERTDDDKTLALAVWNGAGQG